MKDFCGAHSRVFALGFHFECQVIVRCHSKSKSTLRPPSSAFPVSAIKGIIKGMFAILRIFWLLTLVPAIYSSATCMNDVVKACKLDNFSYQPGDMKQDWHSGLLLQGKFHSQSDGIDKIDFSFANGKVEAQRQDIDMWPEGCETTHELVFIIQRNFKNIFHWLIDQVLPYALTLKEFSLQKSQPKLFVLDSTEFHGHRAAVFENLDSVWSEISGQDVLDWETEIDRPFCAKVALFGQPGRNFQFEMHVEQSLRTIQDLRPSYSWFSDWVKHKFNVSTSHGLLKEPRVVLIDRARSGYRRLLQSENVLEALVARGWSASLAHFEELSFHEQLKLIANADVLIAPHGAALTHLIFMPPWAVVVELRPHGFGSQTTDFWQGYGNLARAATRSHIAWHDPIDKHKPKDYAGIVDYKDFDIAIGREALSSILDVVHDVLMTPLMQRNFDQSRSLNSPA